MSKNDKRSPESDALCQALGRAVARLRESAGYENRERFASASGVPAATLSRVERGESWPSARTLSAIISHTRPGSLPGDALAAALKPQ